VRNTVESGHMTFHFPTTPASVLSMNEVQASVKNQADAVQVHVLISVNAH